MESEYSIQVKNAEKYFKIYKDKGKELKERILFRSRNRYEKHKVLNGVSFDIKKGETVGLIGRNGCGKSTTLKLLTKILRPNSGEIIVNGRISSLIELGAGFHPDMTGRENIYINASIFGLSRGDVNKRLDKIIEFSELGEYIDNPVRTYSSGMYMRLGFSVAINVDAQVLLVDEILAVGDVNFQKKCFDRLNQVKKDGTTIVIVSHDMEQLYRLCDRLIWLEKGDIVEDGEARIVGEHYLESMERERLSR
ncbi:MAG: ABC transporter ATP-binding protein [Lachnospiraceae bacterium]|nr:ABC transporter ATP-binding protein [Lachnospiraceae bacterium]